MDEGGEGTALGVECGVGECAVDEDGAGCGGGAVVGEEGADVDCHGGEGQDAQTWIRNGTGDDT